MDDRLYPAVAAAFFGALAALCLLVPYVAVQYRRRGAVGLGRSVLALAALVYALALVSYVVLPLPQVTASLCAGGGAGAQLRPGSFLGDIADHGIGGPGALAANPAVQQAVFNVALFVPLGMLVRYLGSRSVAVTTAVGLGVSLLVELTQLTGDWFIFPCAYRLFDVDDLITNTAGALVGALAAPVLRLVPGQRQQVGAGVARPVTAGRRLLGMVCDYLAGTGAGAAFTFVWTVVRLAVDPGTPPVLGPGLRLLLVGVLPALGMLVMVLVSHRTVGEAVVRLRPVGPVSVPRLLTRWLLGIGGYLLLSAGEEPSTLALLLALASVVAVFTTRGHRGLAHRAVGWEVQDDRAAAVEGSATTGVPG